MFKLTTLTIEGFRGFSASQSFDFSSSFTLLFGENHTGKSSTLNAVEWVLYGKSTTGSGTGMRERVGWEVSNRYRSPLYTKVSAEFMDNGKTYRLSREIMQAAGRQRESLELFLPDGTTVQGDEADKQLSLLTLYSFRDFSTTVYQHQEAIRSVLTQEPSDRNDALDRLLGLSDYRNLLTAIDRAKIGDEFKKASGAKDQISTQIETALRLRTQDLGELKTKASDLGLTTVDLTESGIVSRASNLADSIDRFLTESSLTSANLQPPTSVKEVPAFIEECRTVTNRARGQLPLLDAQQRLLDRRSTIARFQQSLGELEAERTQAESVLQEYERRYISTAGLQSQIDGLDSRVDSLQGRLREINAKAPLIKEALGFLEVLDSNQAGICPICDKPSPNLLEELRAEWEGIVNIEAQNIETQLTEARSEGRVLVDALKRWQKAQSDRVSLDERSDQLRSTLTKALDIQLEKMTDLAQILKAEQDSVESQIKITEQDIAEKIQKIVALKSDIARVETCKQFLDMERKVRDLNAVRDSAAFRDLTAILDDMASFVAGLNSLKAAISEASRLEALTTVETTSALLDLAFRRMVQHPGLPRVALQVGSDRRTGRNSYAFVDDKGLDLFPILSQGDMNCLALAIFLSLANSSVRRSPFGFLILDDPSQSLGSAEKKALVSVLGDVCADKNVILATMDSELRDIVLREQPSKDMTKYEFIKWEPEGGPSVKMARAQ